LPTDGDSHLRTLAPFGAGVFLRAQHE